MPEGQQAQKLVPTLLIFSSYIWIAGGILAVKRTLLHCFMGCCLASMHFLCSFKGFEAFKGLPFLSTQVNGISKIQFSKKKKLHLYRPCRGL